jgi:hypothetical protein
MKMDGKPAAYVSIVFLIAANSQSIFRDRVDLVLTHSFTFSVLYIMMSLYNVSRMYKGYLIDLFSLPSISIFPLSAILTHSITL